MTLHDAFTVAVCAVLGGLLGALFSHLTRPRPRRHRGEHRPVWRRGPRIDPYASTEVPLTELEIQVDAPTEEIPKPGGGVA